MWNSLLTHFLSGMKLRRKDCGTMEGTRCWCNPDFCGVISVLFGEGVLFFGFSFIYVGLLVVFALFFRVILSLLCSLGFSFDFCSIALIYSYTEWQSCLISDVR